MNFIFLYLKKKKELSVKWDSPQIRGWEAIIVLFVHTAVKICAPHIFSRIFFHVLVALLCPSLCNPMDCNSQASLFMEFSRQEYWSGWPFPLPSDLPDPEIKPTLLYCSQILYHLNHLENPIYTYFFWKSVLDFSDDDL